VTADDVFKLVAAVVLGAISGSLGTISVFRSRFLLIDARFESTAKEAATLRLHDKEMLDMQLAALRRSVRGAARTAKRIEGRQRVTLELLADVARSMGLKHRALGDTISREIGSTPESEEHEK
jgi:hypothetical protein